MFGFTSLKPLLNPLLALRPTTFHAIWPSFPIAAMNPSSRFYAAKKKESKGGKKVPSPTQDNRSDFRPPEFDVTKMQSKMRICVDHLKQTLSTQITIGRANPALLDNVMVKVMVKKGSSSNSRSSSSGVSKGVPLSEIAQISTKDAHTLMVVLNDEDHIRFAEKSIRDANLGLNPLRLDGNTLKVTVPNSHTQKQRMYAEHREAMMKSISRLAQQHRNQIRDFRAHAKRDLKKLKIGFDEVRRREEKIQYETDMFMKEIDVLVESKKKEVSP
ncbi:ribosome recycling factor domain-containing protein [Obelidium mucronatum]|nr:ribosome recycling factor domain-containing protein [Obelidium mucronatum]